MYCEEQGGEVNNCSTSLLVLFIIIFIMVKDFFVTFYLCTTYKVENSWLLLDDSTFCFFSG